MTSLIAPDPVREHVMRLRSAGASWQAIGSAAGVGAMTVFDLMHRSNRVSQATAEALLAVRQSDLDLSRVNASGAMYRLRSLQAMGHGSTRVARAIGCHEQSIQRVVNGEARTISADLHGAIAAIFEAWWDKRPPEQTRNERAAATAARGRAARLGWCQPAALDEELLDTPGYQPFAGYRHAHGTGIAPEIRLNQGRISTQNEAVRCAPRPSSQAAPREEHEMSELANASPSESAPRPSLPGVRSVDCECQAQPGAPCTPTGDHLGRYMRAEQCGAIDRQTLKEAVTGVTVIAPHVVVPSPARAAEIEGVKAADQVVRAQLNAGFSAGRIDANAERVLGGRFEQPTATSEAFYCGYDQTAATYAREARELEAGA